MSKQINRTPLRDALALLGHDVKGCMLYQDYLNMAVGTGMSRETVKPISEEQWEVMCDIVRGHRPTYASTVASMLRLSASRNKP